MAGLLNLVPRYLPRYGMAPEWARANRPLVAIFTGIAFLVTIVFNADVDAQGGAYATGVLVLMSSAALAVAITAWRHRRHWIPFVAIAAVFIYTTVTNIIERPEGIKIASVFILTIIVHFARVARACGRPSCACTASRPTTPAQEFIRAAASRGEGVRIIANRPDSGLVEGVRGQAARGERLASPAARRSGAVSRGSTRRRVAVQRGAAGQGVEVGGHRVLRCQSPAIPNAIAALLLYIRDQTGRFPTCTLDGRKGNPITYLLKFLAFGEGDTAPVTREVLRQSEHDPLRRPRVHVG